MLPFNEEQLLKLAEYPKAALEYANKIITKDLHAGKNITNQFGYFEAIVKSFIKKTTTPNSHSQKTSTSQGKARPSNFTSYVVGDKWIPGAEIINNDANYQSSITHVETDLEWALNYEKLIHARTLEDPEFAKRCAKFDRNPIWAKLSEVQQIDIWAQAHGDDCTCRKNEAAGLIMPDIAKKLVEKIQDDPSFKIKEQARKHHWHTADNLANATGFQELKVAQRDELVADKIYTDSLPEQIYIDPLDGQWEEV